MKKAKKPTELDLALLRFDERMKKRGKSEDAEAEKEREKLRQSYLNRRERSLDEPQP